MIICSWNNYKALCADKVFISHQVVSTTIAEPWKEKTYEVIPQIIEVTHAAGRIIPLKY
jgi:hypothetical protein